MASKLLLWFKRLFTAADAHRELLRYFLFKDLTSHQRALVVGFCTTEFRAGESVFERGNPLDVIYFVESGEMEVSPLFEGEGSTVLKKNQFIGVLDLFSGKKRLSSVKALTDLKLKALSVDDLQEMLARDPALGVKLLQACCCFLGGYIRSRIH